MSLLSRSGALALGWPTIPSRGESGEGLRAYSPADATPWTDLERFIQDATITVTATIEVTYDTVITNPGSPGYSLAVSGSGSKNVTLTLKARAFRKPFSYLLARRDDPPMALRFDATVSGGESSPPFTFPVTITTTLNTGSGSPHVTTSTVNHGFSLAFQGPYLAKRDGRLQLALYVQVAGSTANASTFAWLHTGDREGWPPSNFQIDGPDDEPDFIAVDGSEVLGAALTGLGLQQDFVPAVSGGDVVAGSERARIAGLTLEVS